MTVTYNSLKTFHCTCFKLWLGSLLGPFLNDWDEKIVCAVGTLYKLRFFTPFCCAVNTIDGMLEKRPYILAIIGLIIYENDNLLPAGIQNRSYWTYLERRDADLQNKLMLLKGGLELITVFKEGFTPCCDDGTFERDTSLAFCFESQSDNWWVGRHCQAYGNMYMLA